MTERENKLMRLISAIIDQDNKARNAFSDYATHPDFNPLRHAIMQARSEEARAIREEQYKP